VDDAVLLALVAAQNRSGGKLRKLRLDYCKLVTDVGVRAITGSTPPESTDGRAAGAG
jgi:hypothetical protein